MAGVCLHPVHANNQTMIGYAQELSAFLNQQSLSGRIGKDGGFEENASAVASGIMKVHIKVPGEDLWDASVRQARRQSDNFLVYAAHWDYQDQYMIIMVITPKAHLRANKLLPDIIKTVEKDFHSLSVSDLQSMIFY